MSENNTPKKFYKDFDNSEDYKNYLKNASMEDREESICDLVDNHVTERIQDISKPSADINSLDFTPTNEELFISEILGSYKEELRNILNMSREFLKMSMESEK